MSSQSGGDGYGKVRKSCQTGGASGWAKHCGNTDDHKKSNRIERRLAKSELVSEDDGMPRRPPSSKREKKPTRRHLLDRYKHLVKRKKDHDESEKKHLELHHKRGDDKCYCMGGRWFEKWHEKDMKKLLEEFEKHGYEKP